MANREYRRGYKDGFKDGREGHYTPAPNASITIHDESGNLMAGPSKFHFSARTNTSEIKLGVKLGGTTAYGVAKLPSGDRQVVELMRTHRVGAGDQIVFAIGAVNFRSY